MTALAVVAGSSALAADKDSGHQHGANTHSAAAHAPRAQKKASPPVDGQRSARAHKGPAKAQGVARDSGGKIARSSTAKADFKKQHPCPSTGKKSGACPGYVIDHVKPLKRGGKDAPQNMQWQTTAAAKAKDKKE